MSEAGLLAVGLNVDIQRTDGRIHSAVISTLNEQSKTVTVEWYEKGESKGKEIDFQTIFKLNSDYGPKQCGNAPKIDEEIISDNGQPYPVAVNNNNSHNPPRPTMGYRQHVPVHNDSTHPKISKVPSTSRPVAASSRIPPPPVQSQVTEDDDRTETEPLDGDKKNAKNARKSNCVKEIERIREKREERRAAQKAVRDQPEYDTSSPNYDFLMMIKDYQKNLDYIPITNAEPIEYHQICVCVRKRPLNKKELGRKEIDVVTIPTKQNVVVHEPKLKVDLTKYLENQNFRFDYAFDQSVDNKIVYRYTAKPLVECIFERGMATCFAYGQTGSGKTHTMGGEFQGAGQQNYSGGIYALAATDVFQLLSTKYRNEDLIVQSAFFEIYGGKVFDLLNKKEKLRILEDHKNQVQIVGLKMVHVTSVNDVLGLLQTGNKSRTSGQTSANQHSSRSHAVFQIILRKRLTNKLHGKFSLIDLAGNERGADTSSADRNTRMEGAEINKSLLALKECIRALGRKGAHRPFRASKLTQVLRDSFIGTNSRTCMISMISPGMQSCEHTLNTLRYADRVKELGPGNSEDNMGGGVPGQHEVSAAGDHEYQGYGGGGGTNNRPNSQNISGNAHQQKQQVISAGVGGGSGKNRTESVVDNNDNQDDEYYDDYNLNESDDLEMLRSANAEYIDEDMFVFQELVNKIEELEDSVCEKHKDMVQNMAGYQKKHTGLLNMAKQVDYSLEDYSNRLGDLLENQLEELTTLRDNVLDLREALKKEEELSNKLLANRNNNR